MIGRLSCNEFVQLRPEKSSRVLALGGRFIFFSHFNQIRCFQSIFCRNTISYQQIHRPMGCCFSLLDLRQVFHLNEYEDVDNYIDDVDLYFVQVFL